MSAGPAERFFDEADIEFFIGAGGANRFWTDEPKSQLSVSCMSRSSQAAAGVEEGRRRRSRQRRGGGATRIGMEIETLLLI